MFKKLLIWPSALLLIGTLTAVDPARSADSTELFTDVDRLAAGQLIDAVLASNPSIGAMRAASQAAEHRIEQASALDDPMLSYTAAPETRDVEGLDFGQKVQLSQRLPWPGKRRLRGDAARHEAEAAREGIETTRLKLISAAKMEFANWYYAHEALRINRVNRKLWEHFRAVAKLRYANGTASKQDALRAEVEHDKLELKAIVLERRRLESRTTLNALLNRAPDLPVPPPMTLGDPRALPDVAKLRAVALDERPLLRALTARVEAARSRVQLARRNFFPDFKLTAGYNSLWNRDEKRATVGVAVNVPLYRAKRHAAKNEKRARLRRLELELSLEITQVAEDVQRAYDRLSESRQALALFRERLLPAAKDNFDAAIADYQSGAGDFLTLVTVERNLMETELKTQRALADYHRRFARIERVVGRRLDEADDTELEQPR